VALAPRWTATSDTGSSTFARVQGVERTPAALMAWWQTDPTLIVKPGPSATIGGGLPAVTIDLEVPDRATREVADCPDVCTNFLGVENPPDTYGPSAVRRPGSTSPQSRMEGGRTCSRSPSSRESSQLRGRASSRSEAHQHDPNAGSSSRAVSPEAITLR
jgi:hypothetical protein